jgi:hypothetical protein
VRVDISFARENQLHDRITTLSGEGWADNKIRIEKQKKTTQLEQF